MSPTCTVQAIATSAETFSLSFEIHNPGEAPLELVFVEPYLDFEVLASTGRVSVGPVDLPSRRRRELVPPGASFRLGTPLRLRMSGQGRPAPMEIQVSDPHPSLRVVARFGALSCPAAPLDLE